MLFILGFIAFAHRPLTVDEVIATWSFDFVTMEVRRSDDRATITEEDLLRILPGLIEVVVDSYGKRNVQFIHFSVKEYLTGGILLDHDVCGYFLDRDSAVLAIATLLLAALEPDSQNALGSLKEYSADFWDEDIPADVRDPRLPPDVSSHSDAQARLESVKRLNGALDTFFRHGSPAFEVWRSSDWARYNFIWSTSTPLICATWYGLHGQVTRLLQQGADPNAFGGGRTPLYYSINWQDNPCTDTLLQNGADPHRAHGDGYTPLHRAAYYGLPRSIRSLLKAGADVWSRTTLRSASGCRHIGATPLHVAVSAKQDRHTVFKLLLDSTNSSGLVDAPDWRGRTPLHYVAMEDKTDIVDILLEGGASVHASDAFGYTPLSLARDNGHERCVKLLEDHLKRMSGSDESHSDCPVTNFPLSRSSTTLTLHAFLKLGTPTPPVDSSEEPHRCSVTFGWSHDAKLGNSNSMITLTFSRGRNRSYGVHYFAKLSGMNADGSLWPIFPQSKSSRRDIERHIITEGHMFVLDHDTQANCSKTVAALRAEDGQQDTEVDSPRLLVHLISASGVLDSHSPMSFPLPPPSSDEWEYLGPDDPENVFVLQQLTAAAVHFQACQQNVTNSFNRTSDKSGNKNNDGESPSPDVGVTVADQTLPSLAPFPSDAVNVQQESPGPSDSEVRGQAPITPIERTAAPPAPTFSMPTIILCGTFVAAAVVLSGVVHRLR